MSLKKDLKEKSSIGYVDLFDILFPDTKTKYYELFLKLIKNKLMERAEIMNDSMNYLLDASNNKEESEKKLKDVSVENRMVMYHLLGMIDSTLGINLETLSDFIDYNERKLVEKSDLTTYTTYDELVYQTSLANIKESNNELELQTYKIFENDEWLIIRPLTSKSSTKYGYGTKWCTAMSHDPSYFRRYGSEGMLIYTINKLNGHKVACHKYIYENNITFWSMVDAQIDSIQSGLPFNILEIILKEITEGKPTNLDILKENFGGDNLILDEFKIPQKAVRGRRPLGVLQPIEDMVEELNTDIDDMPSNFEDPLPEVIMDLPQGIRDEIDRIGEELANREYPAVKAYQMNDFETEQENLENKINGIG